MDDEELGVEHKPAVGALDGLIFKTSGDCDVRCKLRVGEHVVSEPMFLDTLCFFQCSWLYAFLFFPYWWLVCGMLRNYFCTMSSDLAWNATMSKFTSEFVA